MSCFCITCLTLLMFYDLVRSKLLFIQSSYLADTVPVGNGDVHPPPHVLHLRQSDLLVQNTPIQTSSLPACQRSYHTHTGIVPHPYSPR